MTVDWRDDPDRWVERRVSYLSSSDVGLDARTAEAAAWSALGYSASGIADLMGVGGSTAASYLDRAEAAARGLTCRSVADLGGDPESPVDGLPSPPSRECPACLKERVCSVREAELTFRSLKTWGATEMLEDASHVCSWCRVVRIDGVWTRMQTVDSRAYQLSNASSSKSASDYRKVLTRGIDPDKQQRRSRGVENSDDLEW